MTGWKPIETAPKDGTRVLLAFSARVHVGWWIDEVTTRYGREHRSQQEWHVEGMDLLWRDRPKPTHWMPLPALPARQPEPELTAAPAL
jgi:hypothetical protein